MFEIIQYSFFQRAILVAVFISIISGIIGSYIHIKKMSLVTGSIAHSAFGGLGIAYYLGFIPIYGALIFSLISASFISVFRSLAKNRMDTLLNVLWAFGMSIGLLFMFKTPGYNADLFSYLFGDILLIGNEKIIFIIILSLIIIFISIIFHNAIIAVLFDENFSKVRNINVNFIYMVLLNLFAITIVVLVNIVGIVLLIALLSIPVAIARFFSKTIFELIIYSIVVNFVIIIGGLVIGLYIDLPPSPVIILISVVIYMILVIIEYYEKRNFFFKKT